MSWLSARFFTYLQQAPFYRAAHQAAVQHLPKGHGQRWADIGCGPGLVAALAHEHGYVVTGRDIDPDSITAAQAGHPSDICFEQAGWEAPFPNEVRPQVISAASLLIVLPERQAALRTLAAQLAPGGTLLIIETTPAMRLRQALAWLVAHRWPPRGWLLLLWALARRGKAVNASELSLPGFHTHAHPLMDGLLCAWRLQAA